MSRLTPIEEFHTLSTLSLWNMLQACVRNVGVPLKAGTELPVRARVIFKILEQRLGLVSPDF